MGKGINSTVDEGQTPVLAYAFQPRIARNGRGDMGDGVSAPNTGKGDAAPCVAFVQNTRDEVRLMNGDGKIAGALSAEPGMTQQCYVAQAMQVRRLTPRECERLQGFNPVLEIVRVQGCIDRQNKSVDVEMQCHRLQSSAWNAAGKEYLQFARTAKSDSLMRQAGHGLHVALYARQHYEEKHPVLHNVTSGSKLNASSADQPDWSRSPIEDESFAVLLAPHWENLAKTAAHGKAASLQNVRLSTQGETGNSSAVMFGAGTEESASDVGIDASLEKSIISHLGRVMPTCDSPIATSLCSVIRAISSCIPSATSSESFCFDLVLERDHTAISYRDKPAADGPRYKALGNSMAVPVMRHIGIKIMEALWS